MIYLIPNFIMFIVNKQRQVMLAGVFFFNLGCFITVSFMRIECATSIEPSYSTGTVKNTIEKTTQLVQRFVMKDCIEYAVLILSSPDNSHRRDTIRNTWKYLLNNIVVDNGETLYRWNITRKDLRQPTVKFVKLYFVIGCAELSKEKLLGLNKEKEVNKDVLLLDNLKDSYDKLASKVLESLKWLHRSVDGLKYVIKCDDDSFVRVDLIVRELETYGPDLNYSPMTRRDSGEYKELGVRYKGLYWGYFKGNAVVFAKGKWHEADWFLCDKYLPYALGGGYVLSANIVKFIVDNADMLSVYKSEDVSVGVWTSALGHINRVHDERFDTEWTSRGCRNTHLVRHKQAPQHMQEMFHQLVHTGGVAQCRMETQNRPAYSYNWNALPSKCCNVIS